MTLHETHVMAALHDRLPHDLEEIAVATGLPVAVVAVVLTDLEDRGSVASRDAEVH